MSISDKAYSYIQYDIANLVDQSEKDEIIACIRDIRGKLSLLRSLDVITDDQHFSLEEEMGVVRKALAKRLNVE